MILDISYGDVQINPASMGGNGFSWSPGTVSAANLLVARIELDLTDTNILTPGGPALGIGFMTWPAAGGHLFVLHAFARISNNVGGSGSYDVSVGGNSPGYDTYLSAFTVNAGVNLRRGAAVGDMGTALSTGGGDNDWDWAEGDTQFGVNIDGTNFTGPLTSGTLTVGIVFMPLGVL